MLIVLSPAKSLDYDTAPTTDVHTTPSFIPRSAELIEVLKALSPAQVGSLMGISDQLAVLNVNRYASWSRKFSAKNSKQAVLAFNGDVYEGLDAASLNAKQLDFVQNHVRILSGLYGMLRPLDLMQPYRLEMGTKLANPHGKDLYAFWGNEVTEALNAELASQKAPVLVNLASEEYFKVVKPKLLKAKVISPVFEDWKGGKYKIISFYAKRARGLMARYAALKNISQPEKLKGFDLDGYAFAEDASTESSWVFRRKLEA
ncbi:peroxide stress protein YaaA [Herbaspirillum sp. LeCh32-8]|uniref:peroxide stress protein YaaA n=1 Tax=Herbaspirillum sp. LeCh32-8 TaxID=2821356 RepID=UPI001AE350E4|nr:peroxide stress protein YaaA [Herbaspirillum sp. LeCh32-8]MBP0599652.1 peroxide stress protein YaaA [Herbaspirillum sp. LeCh32-8]